MQGIAWLLLEKRDNTSYQGSIEKLTELVGKIPKPKKPNDPYADVDLRTFYWIGQIREFISLTPEHVPESFAEAIDKLDAAVDRQLPDGKRSYEQGRKKSHDVYDDFQKRDRRSNRSG